MAAFTGKLNFWAAEDVFSSQPKFNLDARSYELTSSIWLGNLQTAKLEKSGYTGEKDGGVI